MSESATILLKPETKEAAKVDLIKATASELENLTKTKAINLMNKMVDEGAFNDFKLGGVLAVIHSNEYWKDDGHNSFKEWLDAKLDMHPRKAMYLINIYTNLVNSGVAWDQVKSIGWTKLKEISHLLTPENAEEWANRCKELTTIQLLEYIKAMNAAGEDGDMAEPMSEAETMSQASKVTHLTFQVHDDQRETIKAAIEGAKEEYGTEFDAVALEHVCLAYLGGQSKVVKPAEKGQTLSEMMQGLTPEEVLNTFGEVFPEVDIEATI